VLSAEHLDQLDTSPRFGVLFADAHRPHAEPDVAEALPRAVNRLAEAIVSILARGQANGTIRADVQPLTLAWLVVSFVLAQQFRREHTTEPSTALEDDRRRWPSERCSSTLARPRRRTSASARAAPLASDPLSSQVGLFFVRRHVGKVSRTVNQSTDSPTTRE
jgi:hypothetical protein